MWMLKPCFVDISFHPIVHYSCVLNAEGVHQLEPRVGAC